MTDEEWENIIISWMVQGGWVNDRNDETTLGFSFLEHPHHWIRDYDKKERRFIQYDGNVRVNLVTKKSKDVN